ncbi:hypothetical protein CSC62_14075 [Pseudoxanthomonas jiangsuensis]|uniref:hypothetical protein n=1 Tax=Pseudoxanthomonas jiangsuensis TaxID=619688 RepID=UPI001390D417|nr:hypothetical protein [Pseudoxanthomonas jiangsuensis]KAF1692757.1 hypothetical protein CSC62_14075 [Pseudoxanthomonas jiangsuensis]
MTAATEGRNTKRRDSTLIVGLVNAAAVIYAGTLVTRLTANGNIVPGGTASAGPAVGVAEETVTGDGAKTVTYRRGTFHFANSASGDLIGHGDIGATCYLVDNQTVAKTDNSAARKAAGKIIDVDANGVWVEVG